MVNSHSVFNENVMRFVARKRTVKDSFKLAR